MDQPVALHNTAVAIVPAADDVDFQFKMKLTLTVVFSGALALRLANKALPGRKTILLVK
ncbi:hypothetical protein [Acidisphaera sp. L21]|uniref:hypothetical protein n=1 Tax=Acidisphaera sp. L21 TaxID=1641851 RepID=UPI00131DFA13|nr:hypothetical protein [Acidisphaera sp. L21]